MIEVQKKKKKKHDKHRQLLHTPIISNYVKIITTFLHFGNQFVQL